MKAIVASRAGGPDVLRLQEVPRPEPGTHQALVRVEAAGVNYIDVYRRTGLYPMPFPCVPGSEGAGTVVAVGPNVREVREGDRVAWTGVVGSYAEYVVAPAERLVVLPSSLGARDGAAAMLQGMTAHYLVTSTFTLHSGHTCVVHAAAGGVGTLLCQMAARKGARVIATVSTDEKAAVAREAGATDIILYTQRDFREEVRRITAGRGADVVYDSVGVTTFDRSLECLASRGMLVLFGQSSGPVPPFELQRLARGGSLFVTRPMLDHYISTREELLARSDEVLGGVASGRLRLRIGLELPLAEADVAHRKLEGRETMGKVLLIT